MGQSLIRYSAVACVVAGGMFMGGTGAVAFADTPGDETGDSDPVVDPPAPEPTASPRWFQLPKGLQFPGFTPAGTAPRVGFIPPPVMNLPATLGPTTAPDGSPTTRQARTITLPFVIDTATKPAPQQLPDAAVVPEGPQVADVVDGTPTADDRKPAATTPRPTIDLTRLVPRGVPTGPPVTIENPLRALLPEDLDLHKPVAPQLLPPPLVVILNAVAQQVPLTGLVITPVMEFVAPPFFADVVIPMLLSDIVVPTLALDAMFPGPPSTSLPLTNAAPLPGRSSLPPELAPMGMDVFQAPALPEGPAPEPTVVEKPQAPNPPAGSSVDPMAGVEFRAGYSDYLRNAGLAQITAIAVPGAVAILLFTAAGGFIGYRQARAGHVIRAEGITRFLR